MLTRKLDHVFVVFIPLAFIRKRIIIKIGSNKLLQRHESARNDFCLKIIQVTIRNFNLEPSIVTHYSVSPLLKRFETSSCIVVTLTSEMKRESLACRLKKVIASSEDAKLRLPTIGLG